VGLWLVGVGLLLVSTFGAARLVSAPGVAGVARAAADPLPRTRGPDPAARQRVLQVLDIAGRARVDADHLSWLLYPRQHPTVELLELGAAPGGRTTVRASVREGDGWLNVEFEGELELRAGHVHRCRPAALRVNGEDVDLADVPEDLAALVDPRVQAEAGRSPDWGPLLRHTRSLKQEEGRFVIEVGQGAP